ncbi:kinase-like domain-containing protein [Globomyces pollinis-pini]|nr:kinase-like domain-containing protein [Globomyces pollinis-pini]
MLLNREQSLKDYQILRKIGAGGFGKVYLVKLKHATGTYFAMKMITKADIQKHTLIEQITNEVTIQTNLNHCFIVQLELYFQTASYFCILLEYVACGDLYHLLLERKHFSEDETKFYICELIVAFEYLHEQKIIFRDLKPENVLLDSTGHIKLADFGFSKKIFRLTNSFCGTPDYIAPEMIVSKPYTFAVDWWGVGVLTYELTFGQTPFYSPTIGGVYRNILEAKVSWVRNDVSQQLKSFIMDLLVADQKRRLGYKGAVELKIHEWFSDIKWNIVKSRGLKPPIVPPLQYIDELEQNDNPLDNTDSDEIELGEQVNAMPDIVLATTPKKNHSI